MKRFKNIRDFFDFLNNLPEDKNLNFGEFLVLQEEYVHDLEDILSFFKFCVQNKQNISQFFNSKTLNEIGFYQLSITNLITNKTKEFINNEKELISFLEKLPSIFETEEIIELDTLILNIKSLCEHYNKDFIKDNLLTDIQFTEKFLLLLNKLIKFHPIKTEILQKTNNSIKNLSNFLQNTHVFFDNIDLEYFSFKKTIDNKDILENVSVLNVLIDSVFNNDNFFLQDKINICFNIFGSFTHDFVVYKRVFRNCFDIVKNVQKNRSEDDFYNADTSPLTNFYTKLFDDLEVIIQKDFEIITIFEETLKECGDNKTLFIKMFLEPLIKLKPKEIEFNFIDYEDAYNKIEKDLKENKTDNIILSDYLANQEEDKNTEISKILIKHFHNLFLINSINIVSEKKELKEKNIKI